MIRSSRYLLLVITICVSTITVFSQANAIPKDRLLTDEELIELLAPVNSEINAIKEKAGEGNIREAVKELADYYKEKFSSGYFFDWKNFEERFQNYVTENPSRINFHLKRAEEHLALFPADTKWKLPFKGLNGDDITAYILRHLARQHKMMDIAFTYYIKNKDELYLDYFIQQAKSLNKNYFSSNYEKEGNDVFEYFRAGYRVFNWLFVHNMFLASESYDWQDQLLLIKTFLYHAADLSEKTIEFNDGNHHTKGTMALALVSIMFNEFSTSKEWYEQSVNNLVKHLKREVNSDGFQFERSVHYHMGDIDNYYYVYYLAKLNNLELPEFYEKQFRNMFDALVAIAFPNKKLPVLQDDTDDPWSEYNSAKDAMALGTVLFKDPVYKYFASGDIPSGRYWFIRQKDIDEFRKINTKKPEIGSVALEETGYYVMRNGWNDESDYMVISCGLSNEKPDHQHGDMLGIEAYADENYILPNYQVRYFLNDFSFFKNSWMKNVALVDSIPQGKYWKGNEGGSGFGKWLVLPEPQKILWKSEEHYDYFSGIHNGYDSIGVSYSREVLFIKDGFWIVKDNFASDVPHDYYQVWQGSYDTQLGNNHIRSSFPNGAGLEIVQLNGDDYKIRSDSKRGKSFSFFVNEQRKAFSYITLLYPYKHFDYRIDEPEEELSLYGWEIKKDFEKNEISIPKGNFKFLFNTKEIPFKKGKITFDDYVSVLIKATEGGQELHLLGTEKAAFMSKNLNDNSKTILSPGDMVFIPE